VQVGEQFAAYNHDTDATNNVTMAAINTNILIVETDGIIINFPCV